jgi:nickel-dependent lactate racemase
MTVSASSSRASATAVSVLGHGGPTTDIGLGEQRRLMAEALEAWDVPVGGKILVLAPDLTRFHSGAGELTAMLYDLAGDRFRVDVMPTLGTHVPMEKDEIEAMYPGVPLERFLVHNWRTETIVIGEIPADFIEKQSEGKLHYSMLSQVNRAVVQGGYDLIVSIGQVVPHEVIGMANHNKNLFVGVGGADFVNKSHFLGAAYGMERIMGRIDTPVRAVLDYAERFLPNPPVKYVLTVRGNDDAGTGLAMRGLFIGAGKAPYYAAARLAQKVNLTLLDEPIEKALVYLDPREFRSAWLGNKAIYRLRMAMADDGELLILAPAVDKCGEDPTIDALIRKYGYHGTPHTLRLVEEEAEMRGNLSVAAHLIHGSSEGRFHVTYAAGGMTREQVEALGFAYEKPEDLERRYRPEKLRRGMNEVAGEEIFYVDNPALGLWALRKNFE